VKLASFPRMTSPYVSCCALLIKIPSCWCW